MYYPIELYADIHRFPFVKFAVSVKLPNNRSARDHSSFADEALLELHSPGRVYLIVGAPFVVYHLSVSVQPNGKKRLIHTNKCLKKYRFYYEDWRVAIYFEKDACMFPFDRKSGYRHIEIGSKQHTFLGLHGSSIRLKAVNILFFRFCLSTYQLPLHFQQMRSSL